MTNLLIYSFFFSSLWSFPRPTESRIALLFNFLNINPNIIQRNFSTSLFTLARGWKPFERSPFHTHTFRFRGRESEVPLSASYERRLGHLKSPVEGRMSATWMKINAGDVTLNSMPQSKCQSNTVHFWLNGKPMSRVSARSDTSY